MKRREKWKSHKYARLLLGETEGEGGTLEVFIVVTPNLLRRYVELWSDIIKRSYAPTLVTSRMKLIGQVWGDNVGRFLLAGHFPSFGPRLIYLAWIRKQMSGILC